MNRHVVRDRTHLIPFTGASDTQFRIARCFALLNEWHAAIAGHAPVVDMLGVLTRQVSARNVSLYRYKDDRAGHIAAAARMGEDFPPEQSRGALAQYLRQTRPDALVPGSIWSLSRLRQEPDFAASAAGQEWNARSEIIEVSLVVLENEANRLDAIEMVFDRIPELNRDVPPSLVTQALADAWPLRAPGLISRTIARNMRTRGRPDEAGISHILSSDNPCGLSRAEQRVCQLLISGHKAKEIAEMLKLSVPTIRTHQGNIYAKTNTSGQVELIALAHAEMSAAA